MLIVVTDADMQDEKGLTVYGGIATKDTRIDIKIVVISNQSH